MIATRQNNHQDRLLLWLHFILIILIYAATGYYSQGFDDEYFNLMVVEKFGTDIAGFTQTTDVHPPLSYLLNAWLIKLLGSWEWVRLISGLLTASAIVATIARLGSNKNIRYSLILIYLLAFNPALLLWGTSLRWYGYFFPILIWLLVVPQNKNWIWPKLFISFLILGHIGYISFFIFPAMFLYYWLSDERDAKEKSKSILLPALVSLLLYSPQLSVFFKVHYPRSGGQVFSITSGLIGIFSTHFSNQGVFPLSVPGIISAIGTAIMLVLIVIDFKSEWAKPFGLPFTSGLFILLVARIAGKMRNLSVMLPLQAKGFADKINIASSRWTWIAMGMIGFGNLVGTYNVITHEDTTKNSWNIPITTLKSFVENELRSEKSTTLIYSHDPMITWHFEQMGYPVRSPYAHQKVNVEGKKFKYAVVIWTNPGYLPKQRMDLYRFEISLMKKSSEKTFVLGTDKYASLKRRKDPNYPDELIKLNVISDPEQLAISSTWSPFFITRFK